MSTSHYLTCLWPGLPELWWRGRLSSLPLAFGFGILVNAFLIFGWIYPGWIPSILFWLGTFLGCCAWAFYVIRSVGELPELIAPRAVSDRPDRFTEAQTAYLRAEWTEAEKLLTEVLAIEPRDPPALLILCAVYRHQGRLGDAEVLIDEVSKVEIADAWWIEVETERKRIRWAIAARDEAIENGHSSGRDSDDSVSKEEQNSANQNAADLTEETERLRTAA